MLPKLNFPEYEFKLKKEEKGFLIFDPCRGKYIHCTPEEWVRQNCLRFLIEEKKIPISLINVEKTILINGLKKRYDLVAYRSSGDVFLTVECKSPKVILNQDTFDQISIYNQKLLSDFFWVTNGLIHIFSKIDFKNKQFLFVKDIPSYQNG